MNRTVDLDDVARSRHASLYLQSKVIKRWISHGARLSRVEKAKDTIIVARIAHAHVLRTA